jgi:xylulokinase
MFLSDLFTEAFANTTGATIELINTDGAQGAARAAGLGAGFYKTPEECFEGLSILKKVEPDAMLQKQYAEAYLNWKETM